METELFFSLPGLPPKSARGCKEVLRTNDNVRYKRTVNGELMMMHNICLKYTSTISCSDTNNPVFDILMPGNQLYVGSITVLWHAINNADSVILHRPYIKSSVGVINKHGQVSDFAIDQQQPNDLLWVDASMPIKFPNAMSGYVHFRPWLFMIIKQSYLETCESSGMNQWRVEMEEV